MNDKKALNEYTLLDVLSNKTLYQQAILKGLLSAANFEVAFANTNTNALKVDPVDIKIILNNCNVESVHNYTSLIILMGRLLLDSKLIDFATLKQNAEDNFPDAVNTDLADLSVLIENLRSIMQYPDEQKGGEYGLQ